MVNFMIKILVCFKITRDFENITPSELRELCNGTLDLDIFRKKFGSYDEAALETGRRLAESVSCQEPCLLHAVTVGSCDSRFSKDLYSVGFDEVTRILSDKSDLSPEETAIYLHDFILQNGPYTAILTGMQAWPSESGLTPYLLARHLDYPCISQISELKWHTGIHVQATTDYGYMSFLVKAPAVYIVGNAVHPYLKIATLREKLQAGSHPLLTFSPQYRDSQSISGETLTLLHETKERKCHLIEGKSSEEAARILWKEMIKLWNN